MSKVLPPRSQSALAPTKGPICPPPAKSAPVQVPTPTRDQLRKSDLATLQLIETQARSAYKAADFGEATGDSTGFTKKVIQQEASTLSGNPALDAFKAVLRIMPGGSFEYRSLDFVNQAAKSAEKELQ